MAHRLPHIPRPNDSERQESLKQFTQQSADLRNAMQEGNLFKADQSELEIGIEDDAYKQIIALVPHLKEGEAEDVPVESMAAEMDRVNGKAWINAGGLTRAAMLAVFLASVGGMNFDTERGCITITQAEAKEAEITPWKGERRIKAEDKTSAKEELAEQLGFDSVDDLREEYKIKIKTLKKGKLYRIRYVRTYVEERVNADGKTSAKEELAEQLGFDSVDDLREEYKIKIKTLEKGELYRIRLTRIGKKWPKMPKKSPLERGVEENDVGAVAIELRKQLGSKYIKFGGEQPDGSLIKYTTGKSEKDAKKAAKELVQEDYTMKSIVYRTQQLSNGEWVVVVWGSLHTSTTTPSPAGGRRRTESGPAAAIGTLATSGGGKVEMGTATEARVSGPSESGSEQREEQSTTEIDSVTKSKIIGTVRRAYDSALKMNPTLKGKIVLELTINTSGKIVKAKVGGTIDSDFRKSLSKRLRKLRVSEQESVTTVILPGVLQPPSY